MCVYVNGFTVTKSRNPILVMPIIFSSKFFAKLKNSCKGEETFRSFNLLTLSFVRKHNFIIQKNRIIKISKKSKQTVPQIKQEIRLKTGASGGQQFINFFVKCKT